MQSMWYYFKKEYFFPCWNSNQVFGIKDDFAAFFCILITAHKSHFRETYNVFFSNYSIIITKNKLGHIFITNIHIKTYKKTYIYVICTLFLKQ